jgi:hypothetical protein
MTDVFTLNNRAMRVWLAAVLLSSGAAAALMPPAFWICGVGAALIVLGSVSNSARTDQWYSWQREGSLSWFEGWAASTGAVLTVVPLVVALLRAGFRK